MKTFIASGILITVLGASAIAAPHHHRHNHRAKVVEEIKLDLTPVVVKPYVVPVPTDPAQASFLNRMHLENGAEVRSTRWIADPDVTTRDLFALSVTQSLEGGFDSVNMYDRGILSWGIMQWAAGPGSLQEVLVYVKRRLLTTGRKRVWDKVFTAQGLDVDGHFLIAYGKPLQTPDEMRLAFRGSAIPGNYDPKVVTYWATVWARAGRQPEIAALQIEYAGQRVDDVLTRPLPGIPYHVPTHDAATVYELTGNDPYAEALVFALWTNNPRHAQEYVADAAQSVKAVTKSDNPASWPEGAFREALVQRCHAGQFSNWRQRADLIEARVQTLHTADSAALTPFEQNCQQALVVRKSRQWVLLASRHKPVRPGRESIDAGSH